MNGLALNAIVSLAWALFAGEVSLRELVVGYLIGYFVLALFPDALGTREYTRRTLAALRFAGFFLRELITANVQMALFALRKHPPLRPMVMSVPLQVRGDGPLTMLVVFVNLMPGTVVMGFNEDQTALYAHAVGMHDVRVAHASVKRVEEHLLAVLGRGAASTPVQSSREERR